MTIEELRTEMQAGFARVDGELISLREEFARVRDEFTWVREEFTWVRKEFTAVWAAMAAESKSIRAAIKAEGETTRRHFDVVAEGMKDLVRVVAEATAQNTAQLTDHERRLTKLEEPRA
jgi:hypothetical protein